MVKGEKMKGKLDYEDEDEKTSKSIIFLSSDDEAANEDLSLKILEKARMQEAKRKRSEDGFDASDGVRSAAVIDLSSCSSDGVEVVRDPSGVGGDGDMKRKKKKKKKTKDKKNNVVEGDENVNKLNEFEETNSFQRSMNVVKMEAQLDLVTPVETTKSAETKEVDIPDNIVLRKLLRGPRYFDPQDGSWGMCYNCGEEGHMMASCTLQKRRKPCFVCGSLEHNAKQCSQGQDCFICKRRGHIAKNCPEKHQGSAQSSKICLRCGDSGHDMFSCRNDYSPDDLKEIQCHICKRSGHLCCIDFLDNGPMEASCYNCGQPGHNGSGCAKSRGESSGAASPTFCFKCGEEGHFARGCTNRAKAGRSMGELSTPTKRFWKKNTDMLGFRSDPHHLGKAHKKKSNQYEERWITATSKPNWRGGWMADDPVDLPYRKSKANGWRSPATPTKKNHNIAALAAGGNFSSSYSPKERPKLPPGTSSSHGSTKAYHHRYSASRFGNF